MQQRNYRVPFYLLVLTLGLTCQPEGFAARRNASLTLVKTTQLRKPAGHVHQVVPVPGGGLIVRDSDFHDEKTQVAELYSDAGYYCGQFGSFGHGPGQYYRLKSVAVGSDQTVWLADIIGRISRFDMEGRLVSTRLLQRPGYQVDWMVLDEPRATYYLAGYLPKKIYIDHGNSLIHRYRLGDDAFNRSYLDNHEEVLWYNLTSLADVNFDADARGRLYVVDAPIMKLTLLEPESGNASTFPVESDVITPVSPIGSGKEAAEKAYTDSHLIDRVLVGDAHVLLSIRRPREEGFLLQIFDHAGRQLATDVPSPGQLVGKTADGHFYFARKSGEGFELAEYEVTPAARRAQTVTR